MFKPFFFLVFNTTCLTKIRSKRYIPMSHCHGCRKMEHCSEVDQMIFILTHYTFFFLLIKVDFNLFDYVVIPAKRKQNQKNRYFTLCENLYSLNN